MKMKAGLGAMEAMDRVVAMAAAAIASAVVVAVRVAAVTNRTHPGLFVLPSLTLPSFKLLPHAACVSLYPHSYCPRSRCLHSRCPCSRRPHHILPALTLPSSTSPSLLMLSSTANACKTPACASRTHLVCNSAI